MTLRILWAILQGFPYTLIQKAWHHGHLTAMAKCLSVNNWDLNIFGCIEFLTIPTTNVTYTILQTYIKKINKRNVITFYPNMRCMFTNSLSCLCEHHNDHNTTQIWPLMNMRHINSKLWLMCCCLCRCRLIFLSPPLCFGQIICPNILKCPLAHDHNIGNGKKNGYFYPNGANLFSF